MPDEEFVLPEQVIVRVTNTYVFDTAVWDVPEGADRFDAETFFTEIALEPGEVDYASDTDVEVIFGEG